jgi:hypothetical protein
MRRQAPDTVAVVGNRGKAWIGVGGRCERRRRCLEQSDEKPFHRYMLMHGDGGRNGGHPGLSSHLHSLNCTNGIAGRQPVRFVPVSGRVYVTATNFWNGRCSFLDRFAYVYIGSSAVDGCTNPSVSFLHWFAITPFKFQNECRPTIVRHRLICSSESICLFRSMRHTNENVSV